MNAMRFMQALGDIPEDLVRCYFDEPSAAADSPARSELPDSDCPISEPAAAHPIQPVTKSDPETAARPIRFPLPVSLAAVAACLAFAAGWGILISRINQKPISSTDSGEMIYTQDESTRPLMTEQSDSQASGTDSSRPDTTAPTTSSAVRHQTSDRQTGQNETAAETVRADIPNQQETERIFTESAAVPDTSPVTASAGPSVTTAGQTVSTTASETTAVHETTAVSEKTVPLVGEDIIRSYILNEWKDIDCGSWEHENPQYVSKPFYQALSDAERLEIQQKISLLESRPALGYAMKLRQRIMGMDSESRMTAEKLKEYLSAHTVTDDAAESELCSLIARTNRYPDAEFGSGRSFAYYFLDESGRCAVYAVTDEAPLFVYYDAESGALASVPLRDALPIILNL